MRGLMSLGLVAGCYGPKAPAGAPCDPAAPSCPAGQMCVAPGVCATGPLPADAPTDRDVVIDARPDAPTDAAIDASPDAQTEYTFAPSIVECINPAAPDPAACASAAAPNGITVDGDDSGHPWDAFIKVHITSAITGRTVTALRLQVTVSDAMYAESDTSGAIYQVQSFTTTSLATGEPAKVSATPLADDQGAVTQLQTVEWQLPLALATPSTSLYLELEKTSIDGTDYWNLAGSTPPRLIVDVQ